MELIVDEVKLPDQIAFNYEDIKAELTEKVKTYESIVYDDNQIKEAKADKANLNKLKKALNDERIRREREYMQPFNDFKIKINELIATIDKPIAIIDEQVKAYEDKKRQEKNEAIGEMWDGIDGKPDWVKLVMIFENAWLNASTSMKSISDSMHAKLDKINEDMATLAKLPLFCFEATEEYKHTLDINKAIAEGQRLAELQKRKIEQEQARAEQAAKDKAEAEAKATAEPAPNFMNPPADEIITDEPRQWVNFSALLTIPQAQKLKAFFNAEGIQFKSI